MDLHKIKDILPNKLSDLIEVALKDLIKCEKSKKFEINMWTWLKPDYSACQVCQAGAVMAQSLNCPIDDFEISPSMFKKRIANKLTALNEVRQGSLFSALLDIGASRREIEKYFNIFDNTHFIPEYYDNPTKYKRTLRRFVRQLRTVDL